MLEEAFTISLLNLAIYILLSEGYALHKINIAISNIIDKIFGVKAGAIIVEPLFECYVCMSSIWTLIWWLVFGHTFTIVFPLIVLMVCGMSFIIEKIVVNERSTD